MKLFSRINTAESYVCYFIDTRSRETEQKDIGGYHIHEMGSGSICLPYISPFCETLDSALDTKRSSDGGYNTKVIAFHIIMTKHVLSRLPVINKYKMRHRFSTGNIRQVSPCLDQ
jgi:hypothetical protein